MQSHGWVLGVGAALLILLVAAIGGIYFLESKAGLEFFPAIYQKYCHSHACSFVQVVGNSMNPTLQSNQRVLFIAGYYADNPLAHGDIVQVASVIPLAKRVIALPGDKLELREGQLYLNDSLLLEPYLLERADSQHYDVLMEQLRTTQFRVPSGKVVVMGDNRNASTDSGSLGLFSISDIQGRIIIVTWVDALFQKA
ncbi:MAG: signal peptidase I [Candidatus Iainarchaeum archaeon]|uniref:signal peptidase I n=1 Tax=Candidatus Iainarchaeum sp. TaxID=3101447 RepID=A0A7T9DJD1_9ARCH|nr:MAG: signal peptidase I [Candidatus Diapherotrites archaeon]